MGIFTLDPYRRTSKNDPQKQNRTSENTVNLPNNASFWGRYAELTILINGEVHLALIRARPKDFARTVIRM